MYAVTGITGHVGGATARALLAEGAHVRAVVRDARRASAWVEQGAEAAVADFTDRAALAAAMAGTEGAFVMLPTLPDGSDTDHRAVADTIAAAVADSRVPHAVMLSSLGADLAEGTGPIRWLHHLEQALGRTGAPVTTIRPPHFQEKVEALLPAVLGNGVYPVFGDWADVPTSMVATADVGESVAEALLAPPAASEVVDLDAPELTERQVAAALGSLLERELQLVEIPHEGWLGALTDAGVPPGLAAELTALYEAEQRGVLKPVGDRLRRCATTIEATLPGVLAAAGAGQAT